MRQKRQLMAFYSYLLIWISFLIGSRMGLFPIVTPIGILFSLILTMNVAIIGLNAWGKLDNVREIPLSFLQLLVAASAITTLVHYSDELRGAALGIYYMAMIFGLFALPRRYLFYISIYILINYTALELWEWHTEPLNKVLNLSFAYWFVLAAGLMWFVYVGGYIYKLQEKYRKQNFQLRLHRQQLEQANQQLQQVAIRDPLTQLYNRSYLLDQLEQTLHARANSSNKLQVAIIDLDNFKEINDTHGHLVGDQVLITFAAIMQNCLRNQDITARYGGEEFVVVFRDATDSDAYKALDRLKNEFTQTIFTGTTDFFTSFSAGIATYEPGDTPTSLIKRADMALYAAKHQGRNTISLAPHSLSES